MKKTSLNRGFTLVEIMIVVAILGLLIAIGIPGFLTARNRGRLNTEKANLKAISDNLASYNINEAFTVTEIVVLWPNSTSLSDPESYIRKQLNCPINKSAYVVDTTNNVGSCSSHGSEGVITIGLVGN